MNRLEQPFQWLGTFNGPNANCILMPLQNSVANKAVPLRALGKVERHEAVLPDGVRRQAVTQSVGSTLAMRALKYASSCSFLVFR